jgi:hypothetical protein
MTYCMGSNCGYWWMPTASQCCGNDPGEDIEQPGVGNTCCYNGGAMLTDDSSDSILCRDGELYDCNNQVSDDSGLAGSITTNGSVGGLAGKWCTARNSWCDRGHTDCSGTSSCEVNLDTNPACSGATNLGSWCSETVNGAIPFCAPIPCLDKANVTGRGEAWYQFTAQKCGNSCVTSVRVRINLTSPPNSDYDLYLYDSCSGTPVASSVSTGSLDTLLYTTNDTTTFYIQVRYYSGTSCSDWSLGIMGHLCT